MTFVPIGAFSSTKPSMLDAVITGGLLSTGLTVMVNLAVADRFASDTSTALKRQKNLLNSRKQQADVRDDMKIVSYRRSSSDFEQSWLYHRGLDCRRTYLAIQRIRCIRTIFKEKSKQEKKRKNLFHSRVKLHNARVMQRYAYLDDDIELLGYRRIHGSDLLHRSGIGINLEKVSVIWWISAEEGIVNRRVYAVHVDRLYLLGRDIEYAG